MFRYVLIALGAASVGCVLVVLLAVPLLRGGNPTQTPRTPSVPVPASRVVNIGAATVSAEVADTEEARVRGLSGRTSLAHGEGLLFVFPEPGQQGIWMRDMLFPLDIVWLDSGLQVVHTVASATPDSYPTIFTSPVPAQYVLELPAGTCAQYGVVVGVRATIEKS